MAVTEALMSLFLKESVSPARVLSTVRRMDKNKSFDEDGDLVTSGDPEEALMLWVSESCRAVRKKALDEVKADKNDADQVRPFGPKLVTHLDRWQHLPVPSLILQK